MPLPTYKCPVCLCEMSFEVLLVDDSAREALLALMDVHPQGEKFIKPLLQYVGLFAPLKSRMSHSRIAALVNELAPMIHSARIERGGIVYVAPFEYWTDALNAVLSARNAGTLTVPLKSHGYLLEIIAKRAQAAAAKAEQQQHEDARKGTARREEARNMQAERNEQMAQQQASNEAASKRVDRSETVSKLSAKLKKKQSGVFAIGDIAKDLQPQPQTKEEETP